MNKTRISLLHFLLLISLILGIAPVHGEGISVERASGRFKDDFYLVDARINYELSDSVLEALEHGIQLRFDVSVEIKRERKWIWDKDVATAILSYQLEYLPLSNNYLIINLVTGERKYLQELDDALYYLGSVRDFAVINRDALDTDSTYNCFIMSSLKIRNLPLPLQPLALISPKWQLSSQWYEWTIR